MCWTTEPGPETARGDLDSGATYYEDAGDPELVGHGTLCDSGGAGVPPLRGTPPAALIPSVGAFTPAPPTTCASPAFMTAIIPQMPLTGAYRVVDCRAFSIGNAQANVALFDLAGKTGVTVAALTRVSWLGLPAAADTFSESSGHYACWRMLNGRDASVDLLTGGLNLDADDACP